MVKVKVDHSPSTAWHYTGSRLVGEPKVCVCACVRVNVSTVLATG